MTALSIIIPVYNRAALLREAIDSVFPAANEIDLEFVIVDDASTDDTWNVIRALDDPRVRAFRMERNGGQSAARNRGLQESKGTWVKFLDSDDLVDAAHLKLELQAIESEGADIVVSGWRSVSPGTDRTYDAPRFASIADDVLAGLAVPTSAALYVRRSDWRWDPELRKLDDWDYFCQAALGASRIATVPGVAYIMRGHAGARATNTSMLANAREHHRILTKIEERLESEGRLTDARRKRLAQYFYKELRVLTLNDSAAADATLRHIDSLDSAFLPRDEERSRIIRVAARFLGVRRTLRLYRAAKKVLR